MVRVVRSRRAIVKPGIADATVKRRVKQNQTVRRQALEWELRRSWSHRRLAEAWRACRSFAYAAKGAYRKRAKFPFTSNPKRAVSACTS